MCINREWWSDGTHFDGKLFKLIMASILTLEHCAFGSILNNWLNKLWYTNIKKVEEHNKDPQILGHGWRQRLGNIFTCTQFMKITVKKIKVALPLAHTHTHGARACLAMSWCIWKSPVWKCFYPSISVTTVISIRFFFGAWFFVLPYSRTRWQSSIIWI